MSELDILNELLATSPRVRKVMRAYVVKAYRRGIRKGHQEKQVEFDELLNRVHQASHLNGTTDVFKAVWQEAQHPRDHGRFSSSPGAAGGAVHTHPASSGSRIEHPADAKARTLAAHIEKVPHGLRTKVTAFVRDRYDKLVAKFGSRGAKAVLAASVLMLPVPVPFASMLPIALAHAVVGIRNAVVGTGVDKAVRDEPSHEEMEAAARELLAELHKEAGEKQPDLDADAQVDDEDNHTLAAAMMQFAEECREYGVDPTDGLHALAALQGGKASKLFKSFDPNEPRDEAGKWTAGSGSNKGGHSKKRAADYTPDEYRKLISREFVKLVNEGGSAVKPGAIKLDDEGELVTYHGKDFGFTRPASFEPIWVQIASDLGVPHLDAQRRAHESETEVGRASAAKTQKERDEKQKAQSDEREARWNKEEQARERPHTMTKAEYESIDLPLPDPVQIDGKVRLTRAQAQKFIAKTQDEDTDVRVMMDYDPRGRKTGGYNLHVVPTHRKLVSDALVAGKDVPAEVLADYPDLTKLHKAFDESKHPRDRRGRFIRKEELHAAKADPAKAAELRKRVDPADAHKLEKILSGEVDPGHTKRSERQEGTRQKQAAKVASKAAAKDVLNRIRLNKAVTADDILELRDHLPALTVSELRLERQAFGASWNGARVKAEMVSRLIDHAWDASGAERPKKFKDRAPRKLSQSESLYQVVRDFGGIDPDSDALKAIVGSVSEAREYGLSLGLFRKDGNGLDGLAQELHGSGHISVPEGVTPSEHLLEQLRQGAYSRHADLTKEYERAEDEYWRKRTEAESEHDKSEIDRAVSGGEAAGISEAADGDVADSGERAGDAAEPEGEVDTSFDFGTSEPGAPPTPPEEPPETKAPAAPQAGSDVLADSTRDHTAELQAIKPGGNGWVAGHFIRRLPDGRFQVETHTGYQAVDLAGANHHVQKMWRRQASEKKKIEDALGRVKEHGTDDVFGVDPAAVEGRAAVPHGVRGVSLDERTRGRTGMVVRDESGGVSLHLDGGGEIKAHDFEPLNDHYSWRQPRKKDVTGDLFGESEAEPPPPPLDSITAADIQPVDAVPAPEPAPAAPAPAAPSSTLSFQQDPKWIAIKQADFRNHLGVVFRQLEERQRTKIPEEVKADIADRLAAKTIPGRAHDKLIADAVGALVAAGHVPEHELRNPESVEPATPADKLPEELRHYGAGKGGAEKEKNPEPEIVPHRIEVDRDSIFASGRKRSQYASFNPPSISMDALRGANAVWHHQGDPQQILFNAVQGGASEFEKRRAAEIKAARDAGYKFENHRAGKYGTLWVLAKDGKVLTERGMAAMREGKIGAHLPKDTERETAKPIIEAFHKFSQSLPESTRENLGALVTALNRSPLGEHVELGRDESGSLRLQAKTGSKWSIGEPPHGEVGGKWVRQLESSLPRFLAKIEHMANNPIGTEHGDWAVHDRAADAHAVSVHDNKSHKALAIPDPPALESLIYPPDLILPEPQEAPPAPPAPVINVTLPAINITLPPMGTGGKLRRARKNELTGEWTIEELEPEE